MMDLPATAPIPGEDDSGVSGEQQAGEANEIAASPAPLNGELFVETMRHLIAINPNRFGGAYAGPMLSAHLGDAHYDKGQARLQIAELQRKLDDVSEKLSQQKIEYARLEERLDGAVTRIWVQKLCAFCSPIALSFAIDLNKAESSMWKMSAFLGVALLIVSVLPDLRRKR